MSDAMKYTTLDFSTIKQELIRKLSQENNFKDFNFAGSNINTKLELFSAVGDLFGFYINMMTDESFILTADMYENINKLVELVGYNPGAYKSSSTTLTLTSNIGDYSGSDSYKIEIPKFSIFKSTEQTSSGDDIYFTNIEDIIYVIDTNSLTAPLSATSFSFDIPVIQGIPTPVGSELRYIGDGTTYQRYVIASEKAIEEYMKVTIDGEEWLRVDNLFSPTNTATKIYTTRFNKDKRIEIKFGEGTFGDIPALNSIILVSPIISLGSTGNINYGLITTLESNISIVDTVGGSTNWTTFTIDQLDNTLGGADPETVEQLRNRAPALFRTQNRAVTKQDYADILLSRYGQFIYTVKALNYEEAFAGPMIKLKDRLTNEQVEVITSLLYSYGVPRNEIDAFIYGQPQLGTSIFYSTIFLLIVPTLGDTITRELRDNIDTFLQKYKMITVDHVYLEPIYVSINSEISYTKKSSSTKSIGEIQGKIRNILVTYFSKVDRELGELINHSDIVNKILEIEDLSSVILKIWRADTGSISDSNRNIQLDSIEFPKLGTLTIL